MAELSRELHAEPSAIRRWQHLLDRWSTATVAANEDVAPAGEVRLAQRHIHESETALWKKTMGIEIFPAAREEMKEKPRWCVMASRSPAGAARCRRSA